MYYLGIDLGGTNIAVGIVDDAHKIIRKGSVPTKAKREPEAIVADMAALCKALLTEEGLSLSDIAYVGIAAPGSALPEEGIIEYANNLPFRHFEIAKILKKYLPVERVLVENDANAAAYGEAIAGAAKGARYSVMVTLGTGVGGGIVLDNRVYSGFNYAGAELGHMVIEHNGLPCTCGRRGCFEAYSSATGLINMTKEKLSETHDTLMWKLIGGDLSKVSGKTAYAAMRQGDKATKEVTDKYVSYLACGITNIINIFQPDVLCIGGGVCHEGEPLLKPLLALIREQVYNRDAPEETKTKVCLAELGNDAGIIGAAALGNYMK